MPFLFRLSQFFDEPKQGWSENWYFQRDTVALVDLLNEFQQLNILRAALLGKNALLQHLRISMIQDITTGERFSRVTQGRDVDIAATTTNELCQPHDSLLVRCITADQRKRKDVFLGGTWMRNFDRLRHYQPVDDYATRLASWSAEVKARGLGWLSQVVDNDVKILSFTSDPASGKTTYTLDGPVTFAPKQVSRRASVNFPGGHEALDGIQLVSPVAGQPLEAITTKPRPSHALPGLQGRLKTYTYTFLALGPTVGTAPPASIDAQRAARRNRGKSSYAEAGRRAALVRF